MNKISNFKIKVIDDNNNHHDIITNSAYKIKLGNNVINANCNNIHSYKLNDKVKHVEEQIIGTINFIGSTKLSVLWNDGSRERFAFDQLNQLAYVDDVEEMVSPLSSQMNETNKLVKRIDDNKVVNKNNIQNNVQDNKSEMDLLFEQAFDEMEDSYDDIENANPNKLEEQKLQRKINSLEKQIANDKINNIKENAINEIVSLMKTKGMIIDNTGEKVQRDNLLLMNDVAFESFKTAILSLDNKSNKLVEQTEAEVMLQRIKSGGPIIGSFDSDTTTSVNNNISNRDLKSVASSNINHSEQKLNLNGFKDLKGMTKPIQVIAEQKTPSQGIADAIASMDWTTITKVF